MKSKRGRKPMPELWSRLLWLKLDKLENLKTYELGPDLLLGNAMIATVSRGKKTKQWKPGFWPDDYMKEGHSMKVEDNQLSETEIRKNGKKITKFRKYLLEMALKAAAEG